MDRVITSEDILRDILEHASLLGKDGRIEIVIHKANHVFQNYEIRTIKRKDGKIKLG